MWKEATKDTIYIARIQSLIYWLPRVGEARYGGSIPSMARHYSILHRVQTGSSAHHRPIQRVPDSSFLGSKTAGREADHSQPSSTEIKNE
jgi:hypothetical protein